MFIWLSLINKCIMFDLNKCEKISLTYRLLGGRGDRLRTGLPRPLLGEIL